MPEYRAHPQAEADKGHRPGLLDAGDVALTYLDTVRDYARTIENSGIIDISDGEGEKNI